MTRTPIPSRAADPRAPLLRLAAALSGLTLLACSTTQRLSGPLDALPEGAVALTAPSPDATRVTVRRQADGVRIVAPGAPDGFPLDAVQPQARVVAGSLVVTAGPGRAELLWDGSTASVVMLGPGALRVGDLTAGAGLVELLYIDRARIELAPGDRLQLPGGAVLSGDSTDPSGPFVVTSSGGGSLELANQGARAARLAVGALDVDLAGGAIVKIPGTSAAGAPAALRGAGLDRIQAGTLELAVRGDVRWSESEGRIVLEASGPAEVRGMGLVLRLEGGQSASLGPLAPPAE